MPAFESCSLPVHRRSDSRSTELPLERLDGFAVYLIQVSNYLYEGVVRAIGERSAFNFESGTRHRHRGIFKDALSNLPCGHPLVGPCRSDYRAPVGQDQPPWRARTHREPHDGLIAVCDDF